MNTILTDDERREILWSCITCIGQGESTDASAAIKKTEAAVLAKLAAQEPVAYGMPDTQLGRKHRLMMVRLDNGQDGCTMPLYAAPLHAVVQVPQDIVALLDDVIDHAWNDGVLRKDKLMDDRTLSARQKLLDALAAPEAHPIPPQWVEAMKVARTTLEDWLNDYGDCAEGGEADELVQFTRAALAQLDALGGVE